MVSTSSKSVIDTRSTIKRFDELDGYLSFMRCWVECGSERLMRNGTVSFFLSFHLLDKLILKLHKDEQFNGFNKKYKGLGLMYLKMILTGRYVPDNKLIYQKLKPSK